MPDTLATLEDAFIAGHDYEGDAPVLEAERYAIAHIDALTAAVLRIHDRLRNAHGESHDCDLCIEVQTLADAILLHRKAGSA